MRAVVNSNCLKLLAILLLWKISLKSNVRSYWKRTMRIVTGRWGSSSGGQTSNRRVPSRISQKFARTSWTPATCQFFQSCKPRSQVRKYRLKLKLCSWMAAEEWPDYSFSQRCSAPSFLLNQLLTLLTGLSVVFEMGATILAITCSTFKAAEITSSFKSALTSSTSWNASLTNSNQLKKPKKLSNS